MVDFFRKLYNYFYDIPIGYFGFTNSITAHLFTIFYLILLCTLILLIVKLYKEASQLKKENKMLKRKIEQHLFSVLEDKNKK